jgi:hypothetical protein
MCLEGLVVRAGWQARIGLLEVGESCRIDVDSAIDSLDDANDIDIIGRFDQGRREGSPAESTHVVTNLVGTHSSEFGSIAFSAGGPSEGRDVPILLLPCVVVIIFTSWLDYETDLILCKNHILYSDLIDVDGSFYSSRRMESSH